MSFTVNIKIDEDLSPLLKQARESFSDAKMRSLMRLGANVLNADLKQYHADFGKAGKWENRNGPTWKQGPGKRKSTKFAADIVNKWRLDNGTLTTRGFSLINDSLLHQKVKPKPVSAKRAQMLTIPVVKEAHGRTLRAYESFKKKKLFLNKDKTAFMERVGKSKVRAVYIRKKSVRHKPVFGALPSRGRFQAMADDMTGAMATSVNDKLKKAAKL